MKTQLHRRTTIWQLRGEVRKFVDDRDWGKYHNPKNLTVSIAMEASELMEIFQWSDEEELVVLMKDTGVLEKVELELADVIIYCLSLANAAGLDVARALADKIRSNESRYPVKEFRGIYRKQGPA